MSRWTLLLLMLNLTGCSWLNKPYSNNPLIKQGRAVHGDPTIPAPKVAWEDPEPPLPPRETIPAPQKPGF
jgi:hypothetical protein